MYEIIVVILGMALIAIFDLVGYGHYAFYGLVLFILSVIRNDIYKIKKEL